MRDLLTYHQAASELGMCAETIRRYARTGDLRVVRLNERVHRVPRAEIERWLNSRLG
jgi:excisionase family DNA binding protein